MAQKGKQEGDQEKWVKSDELFLDEETSFKPYTTTEAPRKKAKKQPQKTPKLNFETIDNLIEQTNGGMEPKKIAKQLNETFPGKTVQAQYDRTVSAILTLKGSLSRAKVQQEIDGWFDALSTPNKGAGRSGYEAYNAWVEALWNHGGMEVDQAIAHVEDIFRLYAAVMTLESLKVGLGQEHKQARKSFMGELDDLTGIA